MESTIKTPSALSPEFRASILARLDAMKMRHEAPRRRRRRARAAMVAARATWEARKPSAVAAREQEARVAAREQEARVDAAHKIATAARAAREESSSRLFGAILGMGIAIATAGQIALALATI